LHAGAESLGGCRRGASIDGSAHHPALSYTEISKILVFIDERAC
jgi:hypothetical protein